MALISFDQVSLSFGAAPLLDRVNITIEEGERVCLIGRNGAGKSTFLKLISGEQHPDDGELRIQNGLVIASLSQSLPAADDIRVEDYLYSSNELAQKLQEYERISQQADADLGLLERLQTEIEAVDGWSFKTRIETIINRLNLNSDALMSELSGGNRRRVALGASLLGEPDVLLLDEPTNHLDLNHIEWLEQQLPSLVKTMVFITHDRQFVDALATRIIELDRGQLRSYPGNFSSYQRFKAEQLEAEATQAAEFDKKLAQEEVWIRQGIKARRTRNEGRVRALKALRAERAARRDKESVANLKIQSAGGSGKQVAQLRHVSKAYGAQVILDDFSLLIQKGERIGILGDNGSGKSTLIKLILGQIEPDSGEVELGTQLEVAYFDQTKELIDPEKTVFDNIADGNDYVKLGQQSRHVMSYLTDFLFAPERARVPAKALSGGEYSRLMLARLFASPSNLLVLDEPTNDLDMATLELLEEQVAQYPGTLIIVSHDRSFIDNTVTSVLHLAGNGRVNEVVGGYSDWFKYQKTLEAQNALSRQQLDAEQSAADSVSDGTTIKPLASAPKPVKRKRSYKEQRELEQLPQEIEQLETELEKLHQEVSMADFFSRPVEETQPVLDDIKLKEERLEFCFERWEELENDAS